MFPFLGGSGYDSARKDMVRMQSCALPGRNTKISNLYEHGWKMKVSCISYRDADRNASRQHQAN